MSPAHPGAFRWPPVVMEADRGEPNRHLGQGFGTDRTVQVPDRVATQSRITPKWEQSLELRSEFLEDRPGSVGTSPAGVRLVGVLMAALGGSERDGGPVRGGDRSGYRQSRGNRAVRATSSRPAAGPVELRVRGAHTRHHPIRPAPRPGRRSRTVRLGRRPQPGPDLSRIGIRIGIGIGIGSR